MLRASVCSKHWRDISEQNKVRLHEDGGGSGKMLGRDKSIIISIPGYVRK